MGQLVLDQVVDRLAVAGGVAEAARAAVDDLVGLGLAQRLVVGELAAGHEALGELPPLDDGRLVVAERLLGQLQLGERALGPAREALGRRRARVEQVEGDHAHDDQEQDAADQSADGVGEHGHLETSREPVGFRAPCGPAWWWGRTGRLRLPTRCSVDAVATSGTVVPTWVSAAVLDGDDAQVGVTVGARGVHVVLDVRAVAGSRTS